KDENLYFDYFTTKFHNYEKVNIADDRIRKVVSKIDQKIGVKKLTRRIFGKLLVNKFTGIRDKKLEEIMQEHTHCDNLHKNEKIVDGYYKPGENYKNIKKHSEKNVHSFQTMKNILNIINNENK